MSKEPNTSGALIGLMRESNWTMRSIASVVILTFGGLMTLPAEAAIQQEIKQVQQQKAAEGPGSRFAGDMKAIKEHLAIALKTPKGTSLMDTRRQLNTDMVALASSDKEMQDGFSSVRTMIKAKHLPDVILQRELAFEKHYNTEMTALKQGLNAVVAENDDAKAQARSKEVLDRLSQFQDERKPQKFDPKNLPNRSLKPDLSRKPFTTKKQFAEAGYVSNPRLMVATTAPNFDYSQLPGANDPAYLAATTEVTLSSAIKAQAAALNYNPVQIYNWVRNNVQWQPTWGAVQDADLTLSAQRGNAFDISSLLIALLRASNIPARYVVGTINVPEAKFRNWVGGFQDINAAVNFASAGGIPITSLVSGGKITTIQMQHIWVEAAIDYEPSRGDVNKSADTWVPMDASYKQSSVVAGLDPISATGTNLGSVVQSYLASETVDGADGWVTGGDSSIPQSSEQQIQSAAGNYVSQNLPNATYGQLVGYSAINANNTAGLPATLPNSLVVIGARYGTLPAQLEQSITFAIGVDATGEPLDAISFPWARLNNHKVTLSFVPTTPSDAQALQSLLPAGEITDISQIPSSVPAYLISVTPHLNIDGNVAIAGQSLSLGNTVEFMFSANFAGRNSIPNTYDVIAGSYLDVSVIAGNISPAGFADLKARIQSTQAAINSQDINQINALDNDTVLGDMFQTGILGYYGQYLSIAALMGRNQGGHHYLAAGLGSFGYEPQVNYVFDIPQSIHDGGLYMNMPMVNIIGYDRPGFTSKPMFGLELGVLSSALEGIVPQQIFAPGTTSFTGVSAIKVLSDAAAQGQRMYRVTSQNEVAALANLSLPQDAMADIQNAVAAGKIVITHTTSVAESGWTGAGYIIFDPQTGDGAYKISGGQNGGFAKFTGRLELLSVFALAIIAVHLAFIAGLGLGLLIAALEIFNLFAFIDSMNKAKTQADYNSAVFVTYLTESMAFILPEDVAEVNIVQWFGAIFGGEILSNPFGWFY